MKLKVCPFCGFDPILDWNVSKIGYFAVVKCPSCGVTTKPTLIADKYFEDDFNKTDEFWDIEPFRIVAARWNMRKRNQRRKGG